MDFENIDERLENWGRVVRSPRFQSGECALWAKWYVTLRDLGRVPDMPSMTKDERDGWLVERAWSMLPNHVAKWTLKYSYVWQMSPEQVQTRLYKAHQANIRGRKLELILADSRAALSRNIAALTAKEILKNVSTEGCKLEKTLV